MKHTIKYITVCLALVAGLASCQKENGGDNNDGSVVGEWHLVSWSSNTAMDIYLSFEEDGSFDLYQRYTKPEYEHFSGSYEYKSNVIGGTYSDNVPWGDSYTVTYSDDGSSMTFTGTSNSADVAVYEKCDIPEEILSGKLESKSGDDSGLPLRFL